MTARQWLGRGWRLQQEINILMESKQSLFDRLTSTTASYSGEPGAASPDPHKFDGYAAYCSAVDEYAKRLTDVSAEILGVITAIEDGNQRRLLICRYIEFMTWEEIAVKLHYSWRHTFRIHDQALASAKRVIECHYGSVLE